jgi:hypothetical protein
VYIHLNMLSTNVDVLGLSNADELCNVSLLFLFFRVHEVRTSLILILISIFCFTII